MILADEFDELKKEREAFAQENKFRRMKSNGSRKILQTCKMIEEEKQLSSAGTIGGGTFKATIDTGATASFISEELADNLAVFGKIRIDAQLEVVIPFGNTRLTMNLLILPGVVNSLVLGWKFLTQVGTEIKCAEREILIPAGNRHNGWLEAKLSVAVVQQTSEETDTTKFLEAELSLNTMKEHQTWQSIRSR